MKISLSAPTIAPAQILLGTLVSEAQIAVAATPAAPTALPAGGQLYILRNTSPAAQTIRIGVAPSYVAPVAGILLNVNDTLTIDGLGTGIVLAALGSAAGATLDVLIFV